MCRCPPRLGEHAPRRLWNGLLAYAVKFGVVGLIGLVIDVTLFNLLRLGVFGDDGWAQSAIGAKTISTSVAIIFNWLGNRYWTFRKHRRRNYLREFVEYVIVSLGGMAHRARLPLGQPPLLGLHQPRRRQRLDERRRPRARHRVPLRAVPLLGLRAPPRRRALEPRRVEEAQRTLFEEPEPAPPLRDRSEDRDDGCRDRRVAGEAAPPGG